MYSNQKYISVGLYDGEIQIDATLDLQMARSGSADYQPDQFNSAKLIGEIERLRGIECVTTGRHYIIARVGHLLDEYEVVEVVERIVKDSLVPSGHSRV